MFNGDIMKVALIGYGYWGKILKNYIISPFELKYIFTRHKVENTNSSEVIFTTDLNQIFSDREIQAVFIASSIDSHYSICKQALESNKHVFCEKTTTKTKEQLEELYKISNSLNKILYTDYIYVTSPSIQYIKSIFSEIGNPIYINGNIEQFGNFYKEDNVFEVIGSHLLSVIFYLIPNKVVEKQLKEEFKLALPLAGTINIELDSGIKVDLQCSLVSNEKIRKLQFFGDKGSITYSQNTKPNVILTKYRTVSKSLEIQSKSEMSFDENDGLIHSVQDFYNCCSLCSCSENELISRKVVEILSN